MANILPFPQAANSRRLRLAQARGPAPADNAPVCRRKISPVERHQREIAQRYEEMVSDRFVRPMDPLEIARATGEIDAHEYLLAKSRIAAVEADERRDRRAFRWQARVHWACIAIAVLTAVYFAFQMGRGL